MDRPDTPALGFSQDGPNGPNAQIGLCVQRGCFVLFTSFSPVNV
jgi:hypothetical protein